MFNVFYLILSLLDFPLSFGYSGVIYISQLYIKERHKMKRIALLVIVIFSLAVLSGCNTMQGLGKDIKEAGEAIEDAAD
jgi:predicted small secreted protein